MCFIGQTANLLSDYVMFPSGTWEEIGNYVKKSLDIPIARFFCLFWHSSDIIK